MWWFNCQSYVWLLTFVLSHSTSRLPAAIAWYSRSCTRPLGPSPLFRTGPSNLPVRPCWSATAARSCSATRTGSWRRTSSPWTPPTSSPSPRTRRPPTSSKPSKRLRPALFQQQSSYFPTARGSTLPGLFWAVEICQRWLQNCMTVFFLSLLVLPFWSYFIRSKQ